MTPTSEAIAILTALAERKPNMRLRNAVYQLRKRHVAEELERAVRPPVAERSPLDMPVAKRIMDMLREMRKKAVG